MAKSPPNDYIRVSVGVFDSPKLADIADVHGPTVFAVWLHILTAAKRARHLGRIIAPPVRVARAVCLDVAATKDIIDALVAARCIVPVGDRDHHYQVRNWDRWQSMTDAERSRKYRDAQRAASGDDMADDTTSVTGAPDTVTTSHHQTRPYETRPNSGLPGAGAREADDGPTAGHWTDDLMPHLGWLTDNGEPGVVDYMRSEIVQHQRKFDLPREAYLRAAAAAEKKIAKGWRPSRGTPQGWFLSTVRSHRVAVKVTAPDAKADDTGTKYSRPQTVPT